MKNRGFTIVELVVVMTIMAILVSLGTFSAYRAQVNARDTERAADVASIARGLEERYKLGNSFAVTNNGSTELQAGQYPGNNELIHTWGHSRSHITPNIIDGGYDTQVFPGTTKASFTSPSDRYLTWSCVWACTSRPDNPSAFIPSYVTPATDLDKYVYVPIDATGDVCCCSGCVRFELFYKKESTGELVKVNSNHQ